MKSSDDVDSFTTAQLTVPWMLPLDLILSGNSEISEEMRATENGLTLPLLAWCCQSRSETLLGWHKKSCIAAAPT